MVIFMMNEFVKEKFFELVEMDCVLESYFTYECELNPNYVELEVLEERLDELEGIEEYYLDRLSNCKQYEEDEVIKELYQTRDMVESYKEFINLYVEER